MAVVVVAAVMAVAAAVEMVAAAAAYCRGCCFLLWRYFCVVFLWCVGELARSHLPSHETSELRQFWVRRFFSAVHSCRNPWNNLESCGSCISKKETTSLFGRNAQKKLDRLQRNHQKHVPFLPERKNKSKLGLVKHFWLVLLLVCWWWCCCCLGNRGCNQDTTIKSDSSSGKDGPRLLLWLLSSSYCDVVVMSKTKSKKMTTKRNKRGREDGTPANLTHQPNKELEGHNGATSCGSAGLWLLLWLLSLPYHSVMAMGKNGNENNDNKVQQEGGGGRGPGQLVATTNQEKRGVQWRDKWQRRWAEAEQEGAEGGWGAGQRNAKQTNKRGAAMQQKEGERSGRRATWRNSQPKNQMGTTRGGGGVMRGGGRPRRQGSGAATEFLSYSFLVYMLGNCYTLARW